MIYQDGGNQDDQIKMTELTLTVFNSYLSNTNSCKKLVKIPIVRQLAESHINQFSILQGDHQQKQLGQFFKVLSSLWLTEEFNPRFQEYLNQLNPLISAIFSMSTE